MTQPTRRSKTFTVDEANACLPLVRAITSDIVRLARDIRERRQRFELLTKGRDQVARDPYAEEVAHMQQVLERDSGRLHEYERELLELGAIPQSPTEGLVDFPSLLDGRLVFLCWKYDEPEVLYWHDRDSGFAGRQPLTVGSASGSRRGRSGRSLPRFRLTPSVSKRPAVA